MNDKDLLELNAWIAEHVMGWEHCHNRNRFGWVGYAPCATRKVVSEIPGKYKTCKTSAMTMEVPHYTTDPAAAMQVLEKCAESGVLNGEFNLPVSIFRRGDKQWVVSENAEDEEESGRTYIVEEAETLPLAICLFAQKLFSKP